MTYWTEDMIKERLDGTLTRLGHDGRIEVVAVDHDYSPSHTNVGRKVATAPTKVQVAWRPAEDELLCRMRAVERPFAEIAWLLARTEASTKKRYRLLRVQGKVAA